MSARKSAELSPESIARTDRKRLAAEEGVRALADVERQAIDVRKNMARLREVREAKEAADAALQAALPTPAVKKRSRKAAP
ncbi:transcriptional regulator [Bradyrhizobium sp. 14AA]